MLGNVLNTQLRVSHILKETSEIGTQSPHCSDWESEATSLNGRARVWDGVQLSLLTAKGVDEMHQGCWTRD